MGILLALCTYGVYAAFACRIVWRILIVRERDGHPNENPPVRTPMPLLKALGDILLFSRLFFVNPRLWIGEWIFHISFLLVILRHLRYILNPVPEWVAALQAVGAFAGYVLPFSLLYIIAVKAAIEKKNYISGLNFFLLGTVLLLAVTGLLMRTFARPDLVGIKGFVTGIFSFAPDIPLEGILFGIHFIAALVLLAYLPAHIFAAPFSILNSREREDGLRLLMHEE